MAVAPASPEPVRVVVVVGSARDGRLAPDIARWLVGRTDRRDDLVTDVVDLADAPLPASLAPDAPQTVALRPRLAAAEAFVIVVPEYNRGVPGPLKTLIDSFDAEWEAKPVAFVGYGLGMAGGVRAVEHLRQVFAEFHCVGVKDTVSFPRVLEHYDAEGRFPADPEAAGAAAKVMLDQLVWWGRVLRDAKRLHPYRS
ncbi:MULTISPECIES: NAD(P)H-dependent oxidoreductase [unclassified Streptomyces]|uniref:NADPH-dependent FMN reductase n=1 Tax=unclassified Streptomyces TaxID=2593676 RepID=UPI0001C19D99|nr:MULTISPECIES: NAD(P)H-dependent oxidoreductase [unclassified Streptomyces]AEN14106.1 NADPH-dependent FMN reductase [Streptomyces sp. SirexAA-E]MYR70020.1 NADPH-dependent FMN reductase [Streptomyces sp. SID4939]MYS00107.1 NADPH-dependent FMN reductase [Streptomyces sp. SID4940]MYT67994.1 NADPH-dependent FMN reductase [Streptomyces sp. SID8357]MYT86837.1 NADPH-dependent FMN reductase [Streptomyces sp. SID8360]